MAIQFPNSLDSLTNPQTNDTLDSPSHAGQHTDANDILEALEAKVGIDSSAVNTTHDFKLSGVSDGDYAASVGGTETLTNKTLSSPLFQGTIDGWIDANETWAYATASTITVPSGATSKYSKGDKIKITQNATVKYFYVTEVTDTVLTVKAGTDYTVANEAITANYYSHQSNPTGFPSFFNYTPTVLGLTNPTYSVQTGRFSIIGKQVHLFIRLDITSWSAQADHIRVVLPIVHSSSLAGVASYYRAATSAQQGTVKLTEASGHMVCSDKSGGGVILWEASSRIVLDGAATYYF